MVSLRISVAIIIWTVWTLAFVSRYIQQWTHLEAFSIARENNEKQPLVILGIIVPGTAAIVIGCSVFTVSKWT
jgi:hypothetical protein